MITREGELRGEIRVHTQYDRDFEEEVDVAIVGSGPCGAVAARELALAGKRVLLLEEGPPYTPDDFVLDGTLSMTRTMREGGLRNTFGTVMPTMQAMVLGGGSIVNSAICNRPPAWVFDQWASGFDLERTGRADLEPHYDAVAKVAGVAPTPDEVQGPRNLLFRDGCDALGYESHAIPRNVQGCVGSGECFTGCRARAKQSVDLTFIPDAIRAGARVLTSVQVQGITSEGTRATGLEGVVVEPFSGRASHRFRVRAKVVVLAAGVCATPVLLQKSGDLANRSRQVGENLQFHPGVAVMGVFPESTTPWFGATQGYQSFHFLEQGYKLESLWSPPGVLAVRLPGFGHALKQHLLAMRNGAVWDAIGSCHQSKGTVRARRNGMDPKLTYRLHPDDAAMLGRAMWTLTEIFFAAGAEQVLPGAIGIPDVMHSKAEAEVIRQKTFRPQDLVLASTHVFSATRMHGDPAHGVVDEDGRCHDLDNLYIVDTGIFPRATTVNPMFTGMALAHRSAGVIAGRV